jgi:hypothetical protein
MVSPSDDSTLKEVFPGLERLRGLRLDAPVLQAFAEGHRYEMPLRWLRWSRADLMDDLLEARWVDILSWPNVGPTKREGIAELLASMSAELADRIAELSQRAAEGPSQDGEDPDGTAAWRDSLEVLAAWTATAVGGTTWGDLVSASGVPRPPDVEEAWERFSRSQLPLGRSSADQVLADLVGSLDHRDASILVDRVLGPSRRTLDEIGQEHGITRERVRQLAQRLEQHLRELLSNSPEWRSVRWAVGLLRDAAGSFAPLEVRARVLPGMHPLHARIVSWLAGYHEVGPHLVVRGFNLPKAHDLPRLPARGRVIDEFELIDTLESSGIKPEFVDVAVSAIDGLRRVDGQLVDWTGSQVDRAIAVLELRDEPQEVLELFSLAGGSSLTSFRNRIYECEQIIRATRNKVGLRAWGGTRYTSITDLMAQRLTSGPMYISDLARELEEVYEVSPNSVSMYAHAPQFKVTGELVALRGPHDPYQPRNKPELVQGLFIVTPGTMHWHVRVDADVLRGSGRAIPPEVGLFIGLYPGDPEVVLHNPVEDVRAAWHPTSITGPQIGSLRRHALSAGLHEGDVLRLVISSVDMSLRVEMVPQLRDGESPAETIRRLTGLPEHRCDLAGLAQSIGVAESELLDVLRRRKDLELSEVVAELSASGRPDSLH